MPPKTLLAFLAIPPLAFVGSVGLTHKNREIIEFQIQRTNSENHTIKTPKCFLKGVRGKPFYQKVSPANHHNVLNQENNRTPDGGFRRRGAEKILKNDDARVR